MSNDKKFVSYLRVSTAKQGRSGLSIEAQRQAVADLLNGNGSKIVDEFVEEESGRNNDRPQLKQAIATARLHGAKLVVAKLDRLARDAGFLLSLRDSGVEFVAADLPEANRLAVGVLAVVAEDEAERISQRIKDALAAKKARGEPLGNPDTLPKDPERRREVAQEGARASAKVRSERADRRARDLAPILKEIREEGSTSLREIAAGLNERGIPTARDSKWTASAVKRVLDRLEKLHENGGD